MFSGKRLSALPMYTFPFTTVGDDVTMDSSVNPFQICVQKGAPHPLAFQARISPVFLPAYTTPFATVGDDRTAAWAPSPKPVHRGPQDDCRHPVASNAASSVSRPMLTRRSVTGGAPP